MYILFIPSILRRLYLMISYVSNVNSFPKPLSAEEEAMWLERHENGDKEARDLLIEHNMRLVVHVVKKYTSTGRDLDDLISIGAIGLIKGIDNFKVSKGTRLATYAARCIENEILMVLRAGKKDKGEIFLDDPIGLDSEGNRITFNDILCNDDEEVIDIASFKIELEKLCRIMKEHLTPREIEVVSARFGLIDKKELTQNEIAKELNISRSYVSRIEKKAISKIKEQIGLEAI